VRSCSSIFSNDRSVSSCSSCVLGAGEGTWDGRLRAELDQVEAVKTEWERVMAGWLQSVRLATEWERVRAMMSVEKSARHQ
jgi:hypothetical protein